MDFSFQMHMHHPQQQQQMAPPQHHMAMHPHPAPGSYMPPNKNHVNSVDMPTSGNGVSHQQQVHVNSGPSAPGEEYRPVQLMRHPDKQPTPPQDTSAPAQQAPAPKQVQLLKPRRDSKEATPPPTVSIQKPEKPQPQQQQPPQPASQPAEESSKSNSQPLKEAIVPDSVPASKTSSMQQPIETKVPAADTGVAPVPTEHAKKDKPVASEAQPVITQADSVKPPPSAAAEPAQPEVVEKKSSKSEVDARPKMPPQASAGLQAQLANLPLELLAADSSDAKQQESDEPELVTSQASSVKDDVNDVKPKAEKSGSEARKNTASPAIVVQDQERSDSPFEGKNRDVTLLSYRITSQLIFALIFSCDVDQTLRASWQSPKSSTVSFYRLSSRF